MLYVTIGALEHCSAGKNEIEVVCPDIWIHYVVDGAGYYNGERLTEGYGFIVYKDDFASYRPDRSDPWTYIWIRLSGEDSEGLLKKSGLPSTSGSFRFDYKKKLIRIAESLMGDDKMYRENVYYKEGVARLILSLGISSDLSKDVSESYRRVEFAKEYIALNFHKSLKVEDIAARLYVDRKYLRNLFMRYEGVSTKEYLMNYRIQRAKELLRNDDNSVKATAKSVGYDDQLAFFRAFKRHVGLSPSEYRKNAKNFSKNG